VGAAEGSLVVLGAMFLLVKIPPLVEEVAEAVSSSTLASSQLLSHLPLLAAPSTNGALCGRALAATASSTSFPSHACPRSRQRPRCPPPRRLRPPRPPRPRFRPPPRRPSRPAPPAAPPSPPRCRARPAAARRPRPAHWQPCGRFSAPHPPTPTRCHQPRFSFSWQHGELAVARGGEAQRAIHSPLRLVARAPLQAARCPSSPARTSLSSLAAAAPRVAARPFRSVRTIAVALAP
jgi:hypothetical protein